MRRFENTQSYRNSRMFMHGVAGFIVILILAFLLPKIIPGLSTFVVMPTWWLFGMMLTGSIIAILSERGTLKKNRADYEERISQDAMMANVDILALRKKGQQRNN